MTKRKIVYQAHFKPILLQKSYKNRQESGQEPQRTPAATHSLTHSLTDARAAAMPNRKATNIIGQSGRDSSSRCHTVLLWTLFVLPCTAHGVKGTWYKFARGKLHAVQRYGQVKLTTEPAQNCKRVTRTQSHKKSDAYTKSQKSDAYTKTERGSQTTHN